MYQLKLRRKSQLDCKFSALEWMCRGLVALLFGCLVALWLVPLAYEQRGYRAFGSEWMVVFVVMLVTSKGVALLWSSQSRWPIINKAGK